MAKARLNVAKAKTMALGAKATAKNFGFWP